MITCPNCRSKVDDTFTTHCPDCGTTVSSAVESMVVPQPVAIDSAESGPQQSAGRGVAGFFGGIGIRLVVAALIFGGGAAWRAINAADRSDDGIITEAGVLSAGALSVGDCIEWPSEDEEEFSDVRALPCAEPHDAEIFALLSHPATAGDEFPGDDAVIEWSVQACYERFEGYVGRSYETAEDLDFSFFTPTELGWKKYDDRTIQCVIYRIDEAKLSTSIRQGA